MILVTGGTRSGKSAFAEQLAACGGKSKITGQAAAGVEKSEITGQAAPDSGRFLYIATAKITDEGMAERVRRHRQRRGGAWETCECYRDVWRIVRDRGTDYDGILLDSVSTMLTNLLFDFIGDADWAHFDFADVDYKAAQERIMPEFQKLVQAVTAPEKPMSGKTASEKTEAEEVPGSIPPVIVTDEIGLGVIPETALGRAFRDMLGLVNQILAAAADEVYFVVSGIPVKIK